VKPIPLVLAVVLASACTSQPPPVAPTDLGRVAMRTTAESVPACESGHEAALADGVLVIRPGQTICLILGVEGGRIVSTAIASTSTPDNTLVVRAWIEPGTNETFLSLHNPLSTFLSYEAFLTRPGESRTEYTSSCSVLSKRLGIEHWPYLVGQFQLRGFTALSDTQKDVVCR
jgi:hypothetical protein